MDKKADVSLSLKFIIGLIIAIMFIWLLLSVFDKFILFGKDKEDYQKVYFEKLNSEINSLGINQKTSQLFELNDNYLLISFNNEDSVINSNQKLLSFEGTIYDEKKDIILTKPGQYDIALCLCRTKIKKYLSKDDCLQTDDICIEHDKRITSNNAPFMLFGREKYNLVIEKKFDEIVIKNE